MTVRTSAWFFKEHAYQRQNTATTVFDLELANMFTPYESGDFHAGAVTYPFAHVFHVVYDCLSLAQGMALLAASVLNFDLYAVGATCQGLFALLPTLVLDAVNSALSTLTFITRTLFCTMTLGYLADHGDWNYQNERRMQVQVQPNIIHDDNIFGFAAHIDTNQHTTSNDREICGNTYSF